MENWDAVECLEVLSSEEKDNYKMSEYAEEETYEAGSSVTDAQVPF
jgi:hypothetical protein